MTEQSDAILSDSQAATDLENGLRCDAVEFTDGADCGAVVDCNTTESISGLDSMPAHRRTLRFLSLVILLIFPLVLEILSIVAVYIEILLLENEQTMTQFSCLEVYEPLRIECKTVVSSLLMVMRSC